MQETHGPLRRNLLVKNLELKELWLSRDLIKAEQNDSSPRPAHNNPIMTRGDTKLICNIAKNVCIKYYHRKANYLPGGLSLVFISLSYPDNLLPKQLATSSENVRIIPLFYNFNWD